MTPLEEDITPLYEGDPKKGAIFAAAVSGNVITFAEGIQNLFDIFFQSVSPNANSIKHHVDLCLTLYGLDSIKDCLKNAPDRVFRLSYSDFEHEFVSHDLLEIFLQHNDAKSIENLLEKSPDHLRRIIKIISKDSLFEDFSFESFGELVKGIWPRLGSIDKEYILLLTCGQSERYTSLVKTLFDINSETPLDHLQRRELFGANLTTNMLAMAANSGNTVAYELAAENSTRLKNLLLQLESGNVSDTSLIYFVRDSLKAGSVLWFEKFLHAGLNLQDILESDGSTILPLMADLSPERLSTWLKGMQLNITQQMIDEVRTTEGRDALLGMIEPEKADSLSRLTGVFRST